MTSSVVDVEMTPEQADEYYGNRREWDLTRPGALQLSFALSFDRALNRRLCEAEQADVADILCGAIETGRAMLVKMKDPHFQFRRPVTPNERKLRLKALENRLLMLIDAYEAWERVYRPASRIGA